MSITHRPDLPAYDPPADEDLLAWVAELGGEDTDPEAWDPAALWSGAVAVPAGPLEAAQQVEYVRAGRWPYEVTA